MTSSNGNIFRVTGHLSPVPGEFPAQRPVTRSFNVFFDLRLDKRLSKQSWGWWFETLSCPLWRHCNAKHAGKRWWPLCDITFPGTPRLLKMDGRTKFSIMQPWFYILLYPFKSNKTVSLNPVIIKQNIKHPSRNLRSRLIAYTFTCYILTPPVTTAHHIFTYWLNCIQWSKHTVYRLFLPFFIGKTRMKCTFIPSICVVKCLNWFNIASCFLQSNFFNQCSRTVFIYSVWNPYSKVPSSKSLPKRVASSCRLRSLISASGIVMVMGFIVTSSPFFSPGPHQRGSILIGSRVGGIRKM